MEVGLGKNPAAKARDQGRDSSRKVRAGKFQREAGVTDQKPERGEIFHDVDEGTSTGSRSKGKGTKPSCGQIPDSSRIPGGKTWRRREQSLVLL